MISSCRKCLVGVPPHVDDPVRHRADLSTRLSIKRTPRLRGTVAIALAAAGECLVGAQSRFVGGYHHDEMAAFSDPVADVVCHLAAYRTGFVDEDIGAETDIRLRRGRIWRMGQIAPLVADIEVRAQPLRLPQEILRKVDSRGATKEGRDRPRHGTGTAAEIDGQLPAASQAPGRSFDDTMDVALGDLQNLIVKVCSQLVPIGDRSHAQISTPVMVHRDFSEAAR